VEPAPRPFPTERWASFEVVWGVLAALPAVAADREHLLRPLTRWLRERGRATAAPAYAVAAAGFQEVAREAALSWAPYDILLTPTLARLPVPVGGLRDDEDPAADFAAQTRFTPWTSVWNITGAPAVSLPLHRVRCDGRVLPVGVMLGGRPDAEEQLLSLAAQLEAAAPWPAPPYPT
ncbi:MAG TPA: amidase family protein, partial [Jiangellales bacterium]|nr:amidase family protein [Jiangellales bacterium]